MTTKQDYLNKIKKLLALSQSPVKAEATAALLKARKLMAKYKIEQSELDENTQEKEQLISFTMYDIRFYSGKDLWLNNILCIVDRFYPVTISLSSLPGKKSQYPVVSGFSSDVETIVQLIRYIYDSVYSYTKNYCKQNKIGRGKKQSDIRDSYGWGFCEGWNNALKKQNEENPEWALVLIKPDVSSVVNISGIYKPNTPGYTARSSVVYEQGQADGYSFGSQKRIESN